MPTAGSCEEDKPEKEGRGGSKSKKSSDAADPGNSSPSSADSDAVHRQQPAVNPVQEEEDHHQQPQQQQQPEHQDKEEEAAVAVAAAAATPKRPDKPVPCPRCNSMDTKFCYFNNYNVNQPRHFCKNCQRYWTAGGTLRNVPVGAGRRKSKHGSGNSSSHSWHHHHHQRHQEHLKVAQQQQQQQGKVAASQSGSRMRPPALPQELCHFSTPDTSPSSSSMITSLNSSPVSMSSNMFSMQMAKAAAAAAAGGEASSSPVGKSSSVSSSQNNKTSSSSKKNNTVVVIDEDKSRDCQNCNKPPAAAEKSSGDCNDCAAAAGLSNLFNGGPSFWPYNFASWYGSGAAASTPESQQQMQADMAAWLSSVWASGVPAWASLAWNMPWAFAAAFAAAASNRSGFLLPPPPPPPPPPLYPKTLGKHAREGGQVEGSLWAPKTLRIDDPGEVAKSSFWTTLGLDKASSAATPALATQPVASEDKPQVRARPAAADCCVQESK